MPAFSKVWRVSGLQSDACNEPKVAMVGFKKFQCRAAFPRRGLNSLQRLRRCRRSSWSSFLITKVAGVSADSRQGGQACTWEPESHKLPWARYRWSVQEEATFYETCLSDGSWHIFRTRDIISIRRWEAKTESHKKIWPQNANGRCGRNHLVVTLKRKYLYSWGCDRVCDRVVRKRL